MSPTQALQASQPSIRNLATAAQGIAQQIAAQQAAAAAAAATPSNVPNGLTPGGLQVASGITFARDGNGNLVSQNTDTGTQGSTTDPGNPLLWINAYGPQQSVDGSGHVTVDVKQTAQNAVLTWQTMNVGRQTTLNFDQSGGTQTNGANSWIVLNRIVDPSGAPSQILGNVQAQGTVLVINRNGILFGAGSQVNVHSLLASSLDLLNMDDDDPSGQTTGQGIDSTPFVTGNLAQSAEEIAESNRQFLSLPAGTADGGLAALEAGTSTTTGSSTGLPNEVLGLGNKVAVSSTSQLQTPGNITIEAGASITTTADTSASNGGFVLIAAPNVTNAGNITVAPTGQVVLAAGVGVGLLASSGNPQTLYPELTGAIGLVTGSTTTDITPAGTLINTGLVQADRGEISLLGSTVQQNGVIGVTTSVNTPGTITISTVDEYISNTPTGAAYPGAAVVTLGNGSPNPGNVTNRAGALSFGPGSVTAVLPDDDGETATSSTGQTTFTPGSVTVTAGSVWFQSGALVEAPGATVQVAALTPSVAGDATPPGDTAVQGRIYVDSGATIDVSGLADVELPISDILLTIPTITENELADSPLLRDTFLNGLKGVTVDSTLSGTDSDGVEWVGSPILNLAGDISLMPRTVDQLMTNGGTITLSGNEVMTASGSLLNLNGGYIHYLGGTVDTTRLVDADGAIVPIGEASPYDTYVGVAGEFTETSSRWGITNTWLNPLLTGGVYESDYIVGGNAGTLNVFASSAMVLDGTITAQAFDGEKQVQGNDLPTGGTFNLGGSALVDLTQGPNTITTGETGTVILQDEAPQLSSLGENFGATTSIDTAALSDLSSTDPGNVLATTVVPVDTLNSGGFANVSVTTNAGNSGGGIVVAQGTRLEAQPGGSIALTSPDGDVTILGSLIAPSGTISVSSGGNRGTVGGGIVVGPEGELSVAGQWVNNDAQLSPATTQGDSEYINGGTITLSTALASSKGSDSSGSIDLEAGSVIDVSSGGEVQSDGQLLENDGIPEGTAGNLSLTTYSTNSTAPYGDSSEGVAGAPTVQPVSGQIVMDGTIRSEGFAGGGKLTLQATGFRIGGDPAQTPAGDLYLPADFFAQQGFGSYQLNALYDATVAPGAIVTLTQKNLIPDAALLLAPTGTDISTSGLVTSGTLDAYHRQATDLVITAGAYLGWETASGARPAYAGVTGGVTLGVGAQIIGDAGASIGLGSPAQVTVLGSIIAPGGSITLSADSLVDGYALPGQETSADIDFTDGFTSSSKSVWIGSGVVLDVAGVALTDPQAAPVRNGLNTFIPDTGKVLPGGSVTISDDSGYIVAQSGSQIDVSGTSAVFDELQSSGLYTPQQVWSNAGSITLGASSGLLFDGTLQAQPGATQAQGGTLTIVPEETAVVNAAQPGGGVAPSTSPGAQILVFQQSGSTVPAGLTPGADITAALTGTVGGDPTGILDFSADRLTGSGIAILDVAEELSGKSIPVAFTGNVNLTLSGEVVLNTAQILALNGSQTSALSNQLSAAIKAATSSGTQSDFLSLDTAGIVASVLEDDSSGAETTASISAPYVAVIGNGPRYPMSLDQVASASMLNINASFIDLENQFQIDNFGQSTFSSSGDIRLTSTEQVISGSDALAPGELFSSGNLTFQASDLYPSTGSTFILDAIGPAGSGGTSAPTTISFLSNGASSVPLSAGGSLLVDATDIVQQGTVRAPSGSLIFGVGDPTDSTVAAEFSNMPLVATQSVTLADGSVTSVSNDGAVIPYGTTVDGVEWQFNPVAGTNAAPDLSGAPAKYIGISGNNVSLNSGATIDLSGGGDLQAEEWVSGTGGTRDVLAQYNVSYTNSATGTAVPTNVGVANVYAILPGAQSSVAAYDPVFAQTLQPTSSGSTITESMGVGQAGLGNAVGESVYLSGVAGLPAGYYTLLPAKYATLPGAYRVTVASASGLVTPGSSEVLPDGTVLAAGYMANSLTGARSATPVELNLESGAVWQQYSQYTLTSANSFFPSLAASAGDVTPPLPIDGGQLVLAANQTLGLGATLSASAADGGAPAEVDIASQAIQIVGNGEAAMPGYVTINAEQLDTLGAGSLLIGGTRTATTSGVTITPIASSVVLSNDAASPLTGPEIMLVASNDVDVKSGSVIAAEGVYPSAKDEPITIAANASTGGTSDGALLRVSDGQYVGVTNAGQVNDTGVLSIGAGASLSGGQALTLDSSGTITVAPSASLSGNVIAAQGSAITFTSTAGADAAQLPGLVIDPALMAELGKAQDVILRSAGTMYFDGSPDIAFDHDVELSAGTFDSDGGAVTISAPYVTFDNTLGASDPASIAGTGTLVVNAGRIDFGNGDATLSGFSNVAMNATAGIVSEGTGTFDFGTAPVTLSAPVFLADTASGATVKTTGALALNGAQSTALSLSALGGAFSFVGGTVDVNGASISAPAGNVSFEATSGNLTVNSGSIISTAGVAKQFYDIIEYAPGGAITLTADTGAITLASGATLDFAGAAAGGDAGSLTASAPDQTVSLAGTLEGAAATGYAGGSFALNTGSAVDLDSLAQTLSASGVNDEIVVQTDSGNLTLSAGNTLTAHVVSLTANGGAGDALDTANGNVNIDGTIDASGIAGGEIDLYGKSGVNLQGSLIATGSSATEQGGAVNIGTSGNGSTTSLNSTYGYENVTPSGSGAITVGNSAVIDVSGGTAGGLSGGTVSFRAPILTDGTVDVSIAPGAQIKGSRATTLDAYAVWSTDDQSTNAAQHFDGIVDPAGWYDNSGNLLSGTFTSQSGATIYYTAADGSTPASLSNDPGATPDQITADLAADLENDYFTPTTANTDHETFYGYAGGSSASGAGTLMGYVEHGVQSVANQFAGTAIQNFAVVPAIDLDNPDPKINDGNISILTNWNLGAGTSESDLAYRFDGQAPVITFRAENNVLVKASLTDGFFQIANPISSLKTITITAPPAATYQEAYKAFYYNTDWPLKGYFASYGIDIGPEYKSTFAGFWDTDKKSFDDFVQAPAQESQFAGASSTDISDYYSLYQEYFTYLDKTEVAYLLGSNAEKAYGRAPAAGQPLFTVSAPTAAEENSADSANAYQAYFQQYEAYITALLGWLKTVSSSTAYQIVPLQAPPEVALPVTAGATVSVGTLPVDNSPSPVATASNPFPLQFATLMSGTSSTFNLVSGASLASADPLAVESQAVLVADSIGQSGEQGSVIVSGNFAYDNANNPTNDANDMTILAPTTIRTGAGAVNIAAANNIWLYDPDESSLVEQAAPLLQSTVGVIYTAGVPAAGTSVGSTAALIDGNPQGGKPDILTSPVVSPDGAGNISIAAQNDINGLENVIDETGTVSGDPGGDIGQLWTAWLTANNVSNSVGQVIQTTIDFAEFDQGVMSVGGNVSVAAGHNVTDLEVSLPTTSYQPSSGTGITVVGGGNLTVSAGNDIESGEYLVAEGTAILKAGGQITSDGVDYTSIDGNLLAQGKPANVSIGVVPTLIATIDGSFDLVARQGIAIGSIFGPGYFPLSAGSDASASAVNAQTTTGDVDVGTLTALPGEEQFSTSLPASINLLALDGGITVASGGALAASPASELSVVADRSINFSGNSVLQMGDEDPNLIDETDPVRIYSLTGSIIDGVIQPSGGSAGFYGDLLGIDVDKPAFIEAGQDIVNLVFEGQNLREDDVTRIVAGRDIDDTPLSPGANSLILPELVLGGSGYFDVEAGRNIGPLTSAAQAYASLGNTYKGGTFGIEAIGNTDNSLLPHESANVEVLFGVSPGIDDTAFISNYIDPSSIPAGISSVTPALVAFMQQYDAGQTYDTGLVASQPAVQPLTAGQAWQQFQALPKYIQQLFVERVFFSILTDVGDDYNDASSPYYQQYARGYQAINTLFPSSLGYTGNDLGGGTNGANSLVQTGNLDVRNTTIQTQQGGDVSILGPGGDALVGSSSAPPEIVEGNAVIVGPGQQGILTMETGNINIFTDQSLLLAQSRVFTEQGGNITIWSSNGDINAGQGATSSADIPPPLYVCDANHFCTLDAKGQITGAGIGTLQTIPGAPTGDANLLAPRGTVDAGAAGIRVSGDLNVAALQVLNTANIQVQGKATGIPVVAVVDTGALTAASAANSAVTEVAQNLARNVAAGAGRQWQITVEVEGFGDSDGVNGDSMSRKRGRPD
ncbi:filamentous haemagglutinin family protein [Burkholderia sp. WAC0059]|uniref:filamentous haemagglutinin family protein n=1 Tax=Burkholderia sp. WAC0059 TaxID=2066022 RepID=UPI0021556837|nr:filamentous haemagglutinin family protein [Burkholderia sp. WAC0059]